MLQKQVQSLSAPAVAGDFASSTDLRASALAGPAGLVSGGWSWSARGANGMGCRVARFAWLADDVYNSSDVGLTQQKKLVVNAPDPASYDPGNVDSFPQPDGFISRAGFLGGLQTYLDESGMFIKQGSPMTLHVSGEFFCTNESARAAAVGDSACASLTDGSIAFILPGSGAPAGYVETRWRAKSVGARGELVKISFNGQTADGSTFAADEPVVEQQPVAHKAEHNSGHKAKKTMA